MYHTHKIRHSCEIYHQWSINSFLPFFFLNSILFFIFYFFLILRLELNDHFLLSRYHGFPSLTSFSLSGKVSEALFSPLHSKGNSIKTSSQPETKVSKVHWRQSSKMASPAEMNVFLINLGTQWFFLTLWTLLFIDQSM